jgi:hypothetical protein
MDPKQRMYYYDGKNILLDNYDHSSKFDQYYDDPNNNNSLMRTQDPKSFNNTQPSNKNWNSGEEQGGNVTGKSFMNNTQNSQQVYLIPEEVINVLKDNFSKAKGYMEHKPDTLFNHVREYRGFQRKGLTVPLRLQPLLQYSDNDIWYSLNYYYEQIQQKRERHRSNNAPIVNKFKTKFSNDTMKRLYPYMKDEEVEKQNKNLYNIDKFFERMVYQHCLRMKEYSNDENILFNYWQGLSDEERDSVLLKWPGGDNSLSGEITGYLSDDNIILRISMMFKSKCGYSCQHPRPLHDYWSQQISPHERYLKGLFKHDSDTLYKIMHDRFVQKTTEDKEREQREKERKEKEEQKMKEKSKPTKEEYQRLLEKYSKLAQPKDKWRTGRVMLSLKKQYAYDNILRKMIKHEFTENRKFKYPEEYAIYDSDEERKVLFRSGLEKNVGSKENIDGIRDMILKTKYADDNQRKTDEKKLENLSKEDRALEKFIRTSVIRYYKNRIAMFNKDPTKTTKEEKEKALINKFLTEIYTYMLKNHGAATKRRFPRITYGTRKKSRFANYPQHLKSYFFQLVRRLRKSPDGKFKFGDIDTLAFWAPAGSNACKVHGAECPLYCKHNTHNDYIYTQNKKSAKMLHDGDILLNDDERLHLWKRKDLIDKKSKIFLCLSEAEHCTFEPNTNNKKNGMTNEEAVNKRISNKVWVDQMGGNFATKFPLIFKDGICKKAQKMYLDGEFKEMVTLLETAFDLDSIRAHFDPKFAKRHEKKLEELKRKKEQEGEHFEGHEKKKDLVQDSYTNPKNRRICEEVYYMIKDMDDYKKEKRKAAKKLEEEIKMIASENSKKYISVPVGGQRGAPVVDTSKVNPENVNKLNFIKDRYFKFFKSIMCPLK